MIQLSFHELFKDDDVGGRRGRERRLNEQGASQSAIPSSAAGARLYFLAGKTRGISLSRRETRGSEGVVFSIAAAVHTLGCIENTPCPVANGISKAAH